MAANVHSVKSGKVLVFVSMVFIGVLIFSYTDLINEIEKKSKIQEEAGEPPRLPVNGEFEKYDFEPVEW